MTCKQIWRGRNPGKAPPEKGGQLANALLTLPLLLPASGRDLSLDGKCSAVTLDHEANLGMEAPC